MALEFADLHLRHYGLTKAVSDSYAEAAQVELGRYHNSPVRFELVNNGAQAMELAFWSPPDARQTAAWNNRTDTTTMAAYSLALSAIEASRDLFAVGRAENLTGADYYVDKAGVQNFETASRLEVSGISKSDDANLTQRLRQKIMQAKNGQSELPAIACVVGFSSHKILSEDV